MTSRLPHLDDHAVRLLTLDTEPRRSWEERFALMDVYVETLLADADADADANPDAMPQMAVHLSGCPGCAEEAESLRDLVASEQTGSGIADRGHA
jgi:hypothetical protein